MRRSQRFIAAAVLFALCSVLTGCGSMNGFDPTDLLDFLDTKKKLPGERKAVFPEGVPGLEQGVPKDLYKGASQQQSPDIGSAPPPVEETKTKPVAKHVAKGKRPARARAPETAAAPEPDAAQEEGGTAAAPPAPPAKKITRRRTTAPPPEQPAAQSAPQPVQSSPQTQQSAAPFPAPLPSGSFSR